MLDEDLRHQDAGNIGRRRPVLLFGDSFAAGVGDAESFQNILNHDEAFSRDYYLLNYGVSGYGVDQIYLMLQHTLPLYQRTIVIFSLMTFDLDRSILTFREAPSRTSGSRMACCTYTARRSRYLRAHISRKIRRK